MGKYQPTAEQKARAAERRAAFRALCAQVAQMDEAQRGAIAAKYGIVTVEGRALSVHNQVLVAQQHENPSIVGGFHQWLQAGRCVRKGEHGLCIWVPTARSTGRENGAGQQVDGDGDSKPGFIMGTVFDISQTEPKQP